MATDALRSNDKDEMVLALKALGNAGHPGGIKTIMRFLPGVAATPVDLPLYVQSAAVQALRLIAVRDPHRVRARNDTWKENSDLKFSPFLILTKNWKKRVMWGRVQSFTSLSSFAPALRSKTSPSACSCRRICQLRSACWPSWSSLTPSHQWLLFPWWQHI